MAEKPSRTPMDAFFSELLEAARQNFERGAFPNAAMILKGEVPICVSGSESEHNFDPTAHAEVTVIRKACEKLMTNSLSDCALLSTLEPCAMCLMSAAAAGLRTVYFDSARKDWMAAVYLHQRGSQQLAIELSTPIELKQCSTHEAELDSLIRQFLE